MRFTELSKRKLDVISAIVKSYIATGDPVGSKNLTSLIKNSPSPATLRSEMNALCNLGFLSQPHTSAGRVPTSSAYRLYVNSLMNHSTLNLPEINYINRNLSDIEFDAESIPKSAASVLSALTGYPVFFTNVVGDDTFIRQVKLLPVSKKAAVLLAVFSDGRTKNSVCHIPDGLTADLTVDFIKIVNKSVKGKKLSDLSRPYLQNVIAASGINALYVTPLVVALFNMAESASQSTAALVGAPSLYGFCDEDEARRIISLINKTSPLLDIVKADSGKTSVIFGNDTQYTELCDKVVVTDKYYCRGEFCGNIGIIGPCRIDYEQIIPSIEYIADKITDMITDTVNDMED